MISLSLVLRDIVVKFETRPASIQVELALPAGGILYSECNIS